MSKFGTIHFQTKANADVNGNLWLVMHREDQSFLIFGQLCLKEKIVNRFVFLEIQSKSYFNIIV